MYYVLQLRKSDRVPWNSENNPHLYVVCPPLSLALHSWLRTSENDGGPLQFCDFLVPGTSGSEKFWESFCPCLSYLSVISYEYDQPSWLLGTPVPSVLLRQCQVSYSSIVGATHTTWYWARKVVAHLRNGMRIEIKWLLLLFVFNLLEFEYIMRVEGQPFWTKRVLRTVELLEIKD